MRKGFFGILFFAFLLLVLLFPLSNSASAHHSGKVLGESTAASEIAFPPVSAGAGIFLPDSPFYFLDKLKQNVSLAFTFNREEKAKLRARIAGERLAELRVMLARNNPQGINVALSQLEKETGQAASSLVQAASRGQNVAETARSLNETIKTYRNTLDVLKDQATGELKLKIQAAREALKQSKVKVEDELPEDDLIREIENDLNEQVDEEVEEVSQSTDRMERVLKELNSQAEDASGRALKKREDALKKAIEQKNEELKRNQEGLLEEEKERQGKIIKVNQEVAEQARETIKKAQEAAVNFQKAREKAQEAKKEESKSDSGKNQTSGSSIKSGSLQSSSSSSGDSGKEESGKSGKD